jgi:TolB-like protein
MNFSTSSSSKTQLVWALLTLLTLPSCALWKGQTAEPPQLDSPASDEAAVRRGDLIAVFPIDNLTGWGAPLETVNAALRAHLDRRGFRMVDDRALAKVMKRYRVRNTSGLSSRVSQALEEEVGAAGVLLTSLEVFADGESPRISLLSRLVVGGDRPEIVWMDGVGLAGDGHPGLFARGRIDEIGVLLEIAASCLVDSLAISFFETGAPDPSSTRSEFNRCDSRGDVVYSPPEANGKRKFRPRKAFGSPIADVDRRYSVAVIPFLNQSQRKNAGRILELHFVDQLFRNESLSVVEPGLVREQLLEHRVVMPAGPSLENAAALSSDDSLGVDLVLSGVVFDYQDAYGIPKVDFSAKMIEKESGRVVWSSRSHGTGDDGVLFFNLGMVHTAHQLASEMVRGTSEALSE